MYLIGIDFGHGETTASYIDTEKDGKLERLHIRDGNSDEKSKVESAVCRDPKTKEWRFVKDFTDYSSPDFSIHFKAPMNEITPENKEAFTAFIQLVFERILSNYSFLRYDPRTGEKNFCIYVACPSGWDKADGNQIQIYKEFMSRIIPVEWVIKESDAAYFKFKAEHKFQEPSVLVIDIGSSTIDFTAYGDRGLTTLSDGKKHGASYVERSICKYFKENNREFQAAEQEVQVPCRTNHINWLNGVLHYVKQQKEDYYTRELNNLYLDLTNKRFISNSRNRVFDAESISTQQLENVILKQYRLLLQQDMSDVKAQIGSPNVVILSGGAARMPWLQRLVKEVFYEAKVYRDCNPSYVVSDGIAHYAFALYKLKQSIETVIKDFWKEHDDTVLGQMIWTRFNDSLRNKQLPKIKTICDTFDNGNLTYKASDFEALGVADPKHNGKCCTVVFVPAMIKHNESILRDTNGEISRDVNKAMNQQLKAEITDNINDAFKKALHGFSPALSIVPTVNIDVSGLSIDNEWDINKIIEMTRSIYEDWFTYGDIYKDRRSKDERKKFSVPFYKEQEKVNINLPDEVLAEAVKSLKESINDGLDIDDLLRKSLFSIY